MLPMQEAITGQEAATGLSTLSTPHQALSQFYRAFNQRDMALMAANWWHSDDIAMDNPLGGIKRGWAEIQPVYERIFSGAASVYVEYFDYTIHETEAIFYAVGRERGYFRLGSDEIELAIRTTRLFRRIDQQWKQTHHHGSIESPSLLARYQMAILGKTL